MPRSSGLKPFPIPREPIPSTTPNTYAAFKRIETRGYDGFGNMVTIAPNTYAAFKRIET